MCRAGILTTAMIVLVMVAASAMADDPDPMNVSWNEKWTGLSARFRGEKIEYPAAIVSQADAFPRPGEQPKVDIQDEWPNLTMRAQWSASADNWPDEHRDSAMDYALMCSCDADLMATLFPEMIAEGRFTAPPQFRKEARDMKGFDLTKALRGEQIEYQVTAKAGLGAADYTIKTKLRVGLSEDEKTVWYYDDPDYVSNYMVIRQVLFAAHDAGDRILFDLKVAIVMKPRRFLRDAAIKRTRDANQYFVDRLYRLCSDPPTAQELKDYAALMADDNLDLGKLIERPETQNAAADATVPQSDGSADDAVGGAGKVEGKDE